MAYADEYGPGYHALHAEDGVPTHQHWTGITNGRANMALTVGLPGDAAAFVSLPLDGFLNTRQYTLADGVTPYTPPRPDIHHRNETLLGPGDAILMGKRAWVLGEVTIAPALGLSVPLGRTEANPIALGHQGETHQHIQFGSGTFDPMAGLEASWGPAGASWGIDGWVLARQALYANAQGFYFGGRQAMGVYPRWQLVDDLTVTAGLEGIREGADQWRDPATGVFSAPENSGRLAVLGAFGLSWRPAGWGVAISPQIRKIAWQQTQGGTMDQPFALSVGVSYMVDTPWSTSAN